MEHHEIFQKDGSNRKSMDYHEKFKKKFITKKRKRWTIKLVQQKHGHGPIRKGPAPIWNWTNLILLFQQRKWSNMKSQLMGH